MREKIYIVQALKDMSEDEEFCKRLEYFSKSKDVYKSLSRWENLFQLELLFHFNKIGVTGLYFEVSYVYDKRKNLPYPKSGKFSAHIDIVYRRKLTLSHLYTGIELKVNDDPNLSIYGSLVDLARFGALLNSEWEFRGIFAISIFQNYKKSKYIKLVESESIKESVDIIDLGPYKAIVIGWEPRHLSDATLANYKEWLDKLRFSCNYEFNIYRF